MVKGKKILEFIFSLTVIVLPILYQYASPLSFLSLGDFLIIISTAGLLFYDLICKNKVKLFKSSFILLFALILLNFISFLLHSEYYSWSDAMTLILKMIMYTVVLNVVLNHFDFESVRKIYLFLVFVLSLYLIIQFLYYKVVGGYLPIFLKYEWLFSWEKRGADLAYYYNYVYYRYRPSSLFIEPGYFALYVMPALFYLLIKKRKIILPIIITISLILSTSGAGILFAFLVWFGYLTKRFVLEEKNVYINVVPYIIMFVGVICLVLIFLNFSFFSRVFSSLDTRFIRGFLVFKNYDFTNKIFGVGINNISSYMDYYNITTNFDESNLNYGTTLTKSFMEFGIIGFLIFIISTFFLIKKTKKDYFVLYLLILFILYLPFEDILFNFRMVYLLSFIIYFSSNINAPNPKIVFVFNWTNFIRTKRNREKHISRTETNSSISTYTSSI